jgi:hypothetical protein
MISRREGVEHCIVNVSAIYIYNNLQPNTAQKTWRLRPVLVAPAKVCLQIMIMKMNILMETTT